jgi:hypothetical protein
MAQLRVRLPRKFRLELLQARGDFLQPLDMTRRISPAFFVADDR